MLKLSFKQIGIYFLSRLICNNSYSCSFVHKVSRFFKKLSACCFFVGALSSDVFYY